MYSICRRRGVEQRQLAWLITTRSEVRVLSPQPRQNKLKSSSESKIARALFDSLQNSPLFLLFRFANPLAKRGAKAEFYIQGHSQKFTSNMATEYMRAGAIVLSPPNKLGYNRLYSLPWYTEFMKSYIVPISVKGIIFEDNKVWLRKNERNEWELPGGKLEEGEQPEETIEREFLEELGFTVEAKKIIQAYLYTIHVSPDENRGVLVVTYLCELQSNTGVFELEGEAGAAEFKQFSVDEIAKLNMPDFYKIAIKQASFG